MIGYLLRDILRQPYRGYVLDYGIYYPLILVAMVLCIFLVRRRLLDLGYDAGKVKRFIVILLLISYPAILLSARAATMFYQPASIWSFDFFIDQLLYGGVTTYHAGIILPFILYSVIAVVMKFKYWDVFDAIVLYIPLGHAIGRLGCLLVGCCWGNMCTVSLFETDFYFHNPIPLYAIAINLVMFFFLRWLYKKIYSEDGARQYGGMIFSLYFIIYGNARLVMEFFRTEYVVAWSLTQAQIVAITFITIGSVVFIGTIVFNAVKREKAEDDRNIKMLLLSLGGFTVSYLILLFVSDYLLRNQYIRWPFQSFQTPAQAFRSILDYGPVLIFAFLSILWLKLSKLEISFPLKLKGYSPVTYFGLLGSAGYAVFLLIKTDFGIHSLAFWPPVLILSLLNAFSEEILFRFVLYKLFKKLTNDPLVSNLIQSLFYSLVHLYIGSPLFALLSVVYGFIMGLIMEKEDSLVPCILCHFLIDLGAIGLPMLRM